MFPDYIERVMEEYQKKKDLNMLSLPLVLLTPAKIKEECIKICNDRFQRKDDKALRNFFGQSGDMQVHLQAIQKCDVDKFRPLIKFLKRQTNSTDDKNIELLAWLIDFEPRPFELGRDYRRKDDPVNKNPPGTGGGANPTPLGGDLNIAGKFLKWKRLVIPAALLLVAGLSGYILLNKNSKTTGLQACMYWNGERYVQVSCNEKPEGKLVMALDSSRLASFSRITRPDTITHYSIGKVWYAKIEDKLEYYTDSGNHPVNINMKLKPITSYMINKYIQPGE